MTIETKEPTVMEFGEDIDTSSTKKQRIEKWYNDIAQDNWYTGIEEFYTKKKMMLLMQWELTASDEKLIKLLSSIAADLWYNSASKEYVIENGLSKISWNILGK